jgi:hypothetical protein
MTKEQFRVASSIRDTAAALAIEANMAGLTILAYLLEMAAMEASGIERPRRRRQRARVTVARMH